MSDLHEARAVDAGELDGGGEDGVGEGSTVMGRGTGVGGNDFNHGIRRGPFLEREEGLAQGILIKLASSA